jgi:hypothetical protein
MRFARDADANAEPRHAQRATHGEVLTLSIAAPAPSAFTRIDGHFCPCIFGALAAELITMSTKASTLVSVRLPPQLVEEIDVVARDQCRSRNSLIQYLLQTAIVRPNPQRAEPTEAAHG